MKTKNIILCALCAAITCVLAPLAIPIEPVPISLATFAVFLSAALLGPYLGSVSQIIYLSLGAIGFPVFSGFTGGVGIFLSPKGGFLFGYILATFLIGFIYHNFGKTSENKKKRIFWLILSLIIGNISCYILGLSYFMIVTGSNLISAFLVCVLPFLIGDAIKIIAVVVVLPKLEKSIGYFEEKRKSRDSLN